MATEVEKEERRQRILASMSWAEDKPEIAEADKPVDAKAERRARILASVQQEAPVTASVPRETQPQLAGEDSSVLQRALHVGKGLGRMALDTANTPFYLGEIARTGLEAMGMPTEEELRRKAIRNADPQTAEALRQLNETFSGKGQRQPWTQDILDGIGPEGTYAAVEDFFAGEVVDPETNPWTDRLRTIVEWSNPLKAKAIAKNLRSNVDEVAAPIGAAGGEAIVDEMNQDRAIGELSGGGVGTVLGIAANTIGRGKRAAAEAPYRLIDQQGVDTPSAIEAAQEGLSAGEKGTTADLTGDSNLFDLENVVAGDTRVKTKVQDAQDARTRALADGIRKQLGVSDTAPARQSAANYVEQRQGSIDRAGANVAQEAIDEADAAARKIEEGIDPQRSAIDEEIGIMQAADEAAERAARQAEADQVPVSSEELPYQAGERLRNTITAEERAFKEGPEAEAWARFIDGPNLDVQTIQRSVSNAFQGLTTGQRERVGQEFKSLLQRGSNWKGNKTAKPVDVKEWLEDLREAAYTADKDGKFSKEQYYLRKIIDGTENGLGDASGAFKAAKEATREKYTRFRPDKINAAMRAEPEQFGDRLNLKGSSGAAAQRVVEGTQIGRAQEEMVAMLRAEASAGNGVDDAFIKQYGPVLSKLPDEVSGEFTQAAMSKAQAAELEKAATTQTRLSKATVKAAEQEIKLLEKAAQAARDSGAAVAQGTVKRQQRLEKALQNSIVAKFSKEPEKVVRQLMNNPDSADDLRRLNDYMSRQGTGDAFKSQLQEQLTKQVLTMSDASVRVDPSKIREFNTLIGRMKRAGVITAEESKGYMDQMRKSMTVKQRQEALASAVAPEEGEWQNLLASAISAAAVSGLGGSQSLLLGAAVRRWVFKRLSQKGVKSPEIEQLENLILDPQEFVTKMGEWEEIKKGIPEREMQEAVDRRMRKLISAGQSTAIMADENNRER